MSGRELPTERADSPMSQHTRALRVRELVRRYTDFVWRSLRRLGVDERHCDDGCQRVWLVVARRLSDIEAEKTKSFLFSVVVRVASEMRRSESRHCHQPLEALADTAAREDTEAACESRRARRLMDELLSEMSWEQRIVFVLFEVEGFCLREIAEMQGVSKGTTASRLRLAREQLQRGLERYRLRSSGMRRIGDGRLVQAGGGS